MLHPAWLYLTTWCSVRQASDPPCARTSVGCIVRRIYREPAAAPRCLCRGGDPVLVERGVAKCTAFEFGVQGGPPVRTGNSGSGFLRGVPRYASTRHLVVFVCDQFVRVACPLRVVWSGSTCGPEFADPGSASRGSARTFIEGLLQSPPDSAKQAALGLAGGVLWRYRPRASPGNQNVIEVILRCTPELLYVGPWVHLLTPDKGQVILDVGPLHGLYEDGPALTARSRGPPWTLHFEDVAGNGRGALRRFVVRVRVHGHQQTRRTAETPDSFVAADKRIPSHHELNRIRVVLPDGIPGRAPGHYIADRTLCRTTRWPREHIPVSGRAC